MRMMIDTNVILDVLLQREPFYTESKKVLRLCEQKKILGFVSASTITDIFYITRKATGSVDETYRVISSILKFVNVLSVSNDDVNRALQIKASDFEDCLLAVCAKSNKCDAIVTRNAKDFEPFDIPLLLPEQVK